MRKFAIASFLSLITPFIIAPLGNAQATSNFANNFEGDLALFTVEQII